MKKLSLSDLIATSAGLALASSVYTAAAQVSWLSGGNAWLAIGLAGAVCALAALVFGRFSQQMPVSGGVQVYIRGAFGPVTALTVTLFYVVLAWAAGAAEAAVFAHVLRYLADHLGWTLLATVPPALWAAIILSFFFVINVRGLELAASVQSIMTYIMFAALLALAVIALLWPHHGQAAVATALPAPPANGFPQAVAYAIYLFVGFEWVTPLVEDAYAPKLIGRSMLWAVGLLAVTYALFTQAMTMHVPPAVLVQSPVPHLVFASVLGGAPALAVMGIISALATFTSFNAGMMGTSRLVYALARSGNLPKPLTRVHPRHLTPVAALALMFGVEVLLAVLVVTTDAWTLPILLAAVIETLIYAMVGAAGWKLWRGESKWLLAAAGLTLLVFGALAVAALLPPTPATVAPVAAGGLILAFLYAKFVAPRLQAAQAPKRSARRPRRPPSPEAR